MKPCRTIHEVMDYVDKWLKDNNKKGVQRAIFVDATKECIVACREKFKPRAFENIENSIIFDTEKHSVILKQI